MRLKISVGEILRNPFPADGVARVAARERPDSVEMVGQEQDGDPCERPLALNGRDRLVQVPSRRVRTQDRPAIARDKREEIRSAPTYDVSSSGNREPPFSFVGPDRLASSLGGARRSTARGSTHHTALFIPSNP